MQLNPYGEDAVTLAVDLANHPPASVDDLVARCRGAGVVVDMPVDEHDLAATLDLVERWLEIVDERDEERRATLLNRLLAEASAYPRLTSHTGHWHLHYRDEDIPLGAVLRAIVSVGSALHLAGRGMHRLGRCHLPECPQVYADTSRTGRQRYCSARCANLDSVHRHRARGAGAA
jgi:CGNR zinc finger